MTASALQPAPSSAGEMKHAPDTVERIFALLDAFAESPIHSTLTLMDREDEIVLYAFNLWCSSKRLKVERAVCETANMRWVSHRAPIAEGIEITLIGHHVYIDQAQAQTDAPMTLDRLPGHWADDKSTALDERDVVSSSSEVQS